MKLRMHTLPPSSQASVRRSAAHKMPGVYLLSLALLTTPAAHAQFNGPPPGNKTPVNAPVTLTSNPSLLTQQAPDYRLLQGDQLAIQVYGVPEFNLTFRVAEDGTVQLPLIGIVPVQGLTVPQAENLIARKLADEGMVRDPQVTIEIKASPNQVVTVVGEVQKPSVVPLLGKQRLLDVLSAAGGLQPTASHIITIRRSGLAEPITVDLGSDPTRNQEANIPIFPRDTILVPRIGVVYMLGAFKAQGAYPLNPNTPLTLMQAVAIAGGVGYQGKLKDARIIRTVGTQRKEVQVNLGKVISGKEADPVLLSDDIVFVPTNALKAAVKSGGLGTVIALAYALEFYTK